MNEYLLKVVFPFELLSNRPKYINLYFSVLYISRPSETLRCVQLSDIARREL